MRQTAQEVSLLPRKSLARTDGEACRNQSQQHFAVYPRSAGRVACDLGRRDLGRLALRSAAAPGSARAGVRSAARRLINGRQHDSHARADTDRLRDWQQVNKLQGATESLPFFLRSEERRVG